MPAATARSQRITKRLFLGYIKTGANQGLVQRVNKARLLTQLLRSQVLELFCIDHDSPCVCLWFV